MSTTPDKSATAEHDGEMPYLSLDGDAVYLRRIDGRLRVCVYTEDAGEDDHHPRTMAPDFDLVVNDGEDSLDSLGNWTGTFEG